MSSAPEVSELPDLKNGATKPTETTEKTIRVYEEVSVSFVFSVAPFLRSGTSEILPISGNDSERRLSLKKMSHGSNQQEVCA
jgi:hypothetical protein